VKKLLKTTKPKAKATLAPEGEPSAKKTKKETSPWVRHTSKGRSFYRKKGDASHSSATMEDPVEGVQFEKEETAPGDAKWFEKVWSQLHVMSEGPGGKPPAHLDRMTADEEVEIGILTTTKWHEIKPKRNCADELNQSGIVLVVSDVKTLASDCAEKNDELKFHSLPVTLDRDETIALLAYTYDFGTGEKKGNLYFELNNSLRQRGAEARKGMMATWGPFVHYLLRGLNKLPAFKGEVYRGVVGKARILKEYIKGRPIQWGAFSSCSSKLNTTKSFTSKADGVIFKIDLQSGRTINAYSFYPKEDEVLMPCTSKFVVQSDPYTRDGYTMINLLETTGEIFVS